MGSESCTIIPRQIKAPTTYLVHFIYKIVTYSENQQTVWKQIYGNYFRRCSSVLKTSVDSFWVATEMVFGHKFYENCSQYSFCVIKTSTVIILLYFFRQNVSHAWEKFIYFYKFPREEQNPTAGQPERKFRIRTRVAARSVMKIFEEPPFLNRISRQYAQEKICNT